MGHPAFIFVMINRIGVIMRLYALVWSVCWTDGFCCFTLPVLDKFVDGGRAMKCRLFVF